MPLAEMVQEQDSIDDLVSRLHDMLEEPIGGASLAAGGMIGRSCGAGGALMGTMRGYESEVHRRQQQLGDAKRSGDKDAEIDALLAIGEAALEEAPELAFSHFRLSEKVIRGSNQLGRLHEAIGGQGKALRRKQRFTEAIECYTAAEAAAGASGHKTAQVRWMLRRASALRSAKQIEDAKAVVEQAEQLLRPATHERSLMSYIGRVNFFDKEQVGTLAELEGQIGLTLVNENDEQGAEDHYRSAMYFADAAQDWRAVNTWGTNVGNVCVRHGRYGEAFDTYEKALAAALREGHGPGVLNTAMGLADGFAHAYRHEEGGDRLRALAGDVDDERTRLALLDRALVLFDEGVSADKAIDTAKQIESMAAARPLNPEFLAQVRSVRGKMEGLAARMIAPVEGPPALDLLLPEYMMRSEKTGNVERAWQAAETVCDVRLALALAGEKQWARMAGGDLLAHTGLDVRVVFDTLQMLVKAGESDRAIELLQRFKAPSFCVSLVLRLQASGAPSPEARAYLDALGAMCTKVQAMAGPAKPDFIRTVNAVRREAERMRETGEALRDVDPVLFARLGGPVRRHELIDALPYGGGVAIVDFVVGRDATVIMALVRRRDGVVALPSIWPSFTAAHAMQLAELYAEGNLPKQLGGAHTKALMAISKLLHDRLFCRLAQRLGEEGISQLILIPDLLTRNLPLHLSRACGEEFNIPGIDTKDAAFLCEVMPVEYAPCMQAVAASQVYLRPRTIERIAAFADPAGDLPGVRASMEAFGGRSGHPAAYHLATGAAVTKAAVAEALPDADVVMFGTHGSFSPGRLEQTQLILHGDPWTVADMANMSDLHKRALLVLVACEAGAIAATPDDRAAWGIPGALVGAGASAVLANLWPVVEITSSFLLERFLVHLGHRGYRPAAALFRAVRDLRHMTRVEALEYSRAYIDRLRKTNAPPRVLVGARSILDWVDDNDDPHPFAHPYFWGATVVVGSGWHLPAGAVVGPPQVTTENLLKQMEADSLVMQKPRQALQIAREVAAAADGVSRGRAYATMALALLRSADLSTTRRAHREATRLLTHADRLAAVEGDDDLRQRVLWVKAQMETNDVVEKDS